MAMEASDDARRWRDWPADCWQRRARAQTPSRGGTLTVGLSNDAKTYDPIFSVQFTERYVLYLAFDTLVNYGPDFSIQPELAESWETSPTASASCSHCATA